MTGALDGWITSNAAQELTGYSFDHLRRLARGGTVRALQVGRTWLFDPDSLREHQAAAKPGPKPGTRRNVPAELVNN